MIWANVDSTNNDPCVIATNYLDAVEQHQGCPTKVRVDAGTENVNLNFLQEFFTNENSVIVGESTANTRIESWWGQYRKQNAEYFIALFHQLLEDGDFTGDLIDKELMRFCFTGIIQVS
jgi:hypothetical protein